MLILDALIAVVELLLGICLTTVAVVFLMYVAYLVLHALYCVTNIPAIDYASIVVLDYANSVVDDLVYVLERR